jgi:hypothetical protein
MSRDTVLKDAEGNVYSLDNLSTQKWLEGHYSGLDQCCQWLELRANELFSQRAHEKALYLQGLADQLKQKLRPEMVKRAKEHEKEFPPELERTGGHVRTKKAKGQRA